MQRLELIAMRHNILVGGEHKEVRSTYGKQVHRTETKVGEEQPPTTVYVDKARLLQKTVLVCDFWEVCVRFSSCSAR
jgi:hypothetical protein